MNKLEALCRQSAGLCSRERRLAATRARRARRGAARPSPARRSEPGRAGDTTQLLPCSVKTSVRVGSCLVAPESAHLPGRTPSSYSRPVPGRAAPAAAWPWRPRAERRGVASGGAPVLPSALRETATIETAAQTAGSGIPMTLENRYQVIPAEQWQYAFL